MSELFYVAISKTHPGIGCASMVGSASQREVEEFYRDNAGCEIRRVGGREMCRLMTTLPQQSLSSDEEAQSADTGSQQERGQPDTEDLSKVMP
jgi:hypothetical protein